MSTKFLTIAMAVTLMFCYLPGAYCVERYNSNFHVQSGTADETRVSRMSACDSHTPYDCGHFCTDDSLDCIQSGKCDPSTPYRCADSTCVASFMECTPSSCQNYTCWDSSCVFNATECPTIPACFGTYKRCSDGYCISPQDTCSNTTQCDANEILCSDGTCQASAALCTSFNGCPIGEIRCPSGECVMELDSCKCDDGQYQCYSGQCGGECSKSPWHYKILEYSVTLLSKPKNFLELFSALDGSSIGSVSIEKGTFNEGSDVVVTVSSVPDSVVSLALQSTARKLFSPALSLQVEGAQEYGFNKPVEICLQWMVFPGNWDSAFIQFEDACLMYITSNYTFECMEGDLVIIDNVVCGNTTHFSQLAFGATKVRNVVIKTKKDNSGLVAVIAIPLGVGVPMIIFSVVFYHLQMQRLKRRVQAMQPLTQQPAITVQKSWFVR